MPKINLKKVELDNISYITHASKNSLGIGNQQITKDNLSQVHSVNNEPMCTNQGSMTIIGCNSGAGNDSIAQSMSNQLSVPVTGSNFFISPTVAPNENDNIQDKIGGYVAYGFMRIAHEEGEPTLLLGIGEWKQFTPKY